MARDTHRTGAPGILDKVTGLVGRTGGRGARGGRGLPDQATAFVAGFLSGEQDKRKRRRRGGRRRR
jgi:hypothetical protein